MSTSNPSNTIGTAGFLGSEGPFDGEALARLANELFAALPGRPSVPGTAADAQAAPPVSALPTAPSSSPHGEFGSAPVAPYVPPTSGLTPPSDAELRSIPASLAGIGGAPSPTTSAAVPGESEHYFLAPDQPGLPGTAVGLAPSAINRNEAGALPTAPSPPSAVAQPAEPSPRNLPAMAGVAESAPVPFGFRPELVPAPTATHTGGVSSAPSMVPPVAPPRELGALPSAPASPQVAALAPVPEADPFGGAVSPGLPEQAPGIAVPYFLGEISPGGFGGSPDAFIAPKDLPGWAGELESGSYPLDHRAEGGLPLPVQAEPTALPVASIGQGGSV